jgi:hypothetical protein
MLKFVARHISNLIRPPLLYGAAGHATVFFVCQCQCIGYFFYEKLYIGDLCDDIMFSDIYVYVWMKSKKQIKMGNLKNLCRV